MTLVPKLALLLLVATHLTNAIEQPHVEVNEGIIRGSVETSSKGRPFYAFRNVPFAAPPIGKLRFKEPEPPLRWPGIRDGTVTMSQCPHPLLLIFMKDLSKPYLGQEDCLYLSIYTPKIIERNSAFPVMVFIHGGGFLGGGGAIYEGHDLLNEDVILVSINYRLGILGFLSTEDDVLPGNLGLKDQTMALKWVNENIHKFNGDPKSITIFGQSAGAASVDYHLISPGSRGLFQRAILQAGTLLCPWTQSRGQREIAAQVGATIGCYVSKETGTNFSKKLVECLQKVDAEELTQIFDKFMTWTFLPANFGPRVDGRSIPDEPEILLRDAHHAKVDIMIGVTRDEGAFLSNSIYSLEKDRLAIEENFEETGPLSLGFTNENNPLEMSRDAYQRYVGETRATVENADKITELLGDRHFKVPCDVTALFYSDNVEKDDKKVYYYELHQRSERSLRDFYNISFGSHWIAHSEDLFFLFPMAGMGGAEKNEQDSQMTDTMVKLWTNFAATGNPTPDKSLGFVWEPFTQSSARHLNLKLKPEMADDTRQEAREFWNSLDTQQNEWLFEDQTMDANKYEL